MDMAMVICSPRKKALCEMHTIVTSVKKNVSIDRYRDTQKEGRSLTLALVELAIFGYDQGSTKLRYQVTQVTKFCMFSKYGTYFSLLFWCINFLENVCTPGYDITFISIAIT